MITVYYNIIITLLGRYTQKLTAMPIPFEQREYGLGVPIFYCYYLNDSQKQISISEKYFKLEQREYGLGVSNALFIMFCDIS